MASYNLYFSPEIDKKLQSIKDKNLIGFNSKLDVINHIIVEEIDKLPNVYAYEYLSMCTEGGSNYIKEQVEEHKLNRIVVAA